MRSSATGGLSARAAERGCTELLPELAVWLKRPEPPVAVIAESGGRREDRQKMILEGWRDAILSGRYAGVRYDCASASVAHWITRLAKKVGLTGRSFVAAVQMSAEEIAALSPAAREDEQPVEDQQPDGDTRRVRQEPGQTTQVRTPVPTELVSMQRELPETPPKPRPDTAEDVDARERLYREIFGPTHAHRRWRR